MISQDKHVQSIRAALKDRAMYMLYVFRALNQAVGEEQAEKLMIQATTSLGKQRASSLKLNSVKDFLDQVINEDVIAATETEILGVTEDRATMRARYCPFNKAWESAGATESERLTLCHIVQHEDPAMVEGTDLLINVSRVGEGKLICEGSDECFMEVIQKT